MIHKIGAISQRLFCIYAYKDVITVDSAPPRLVESKQAEVGEEENAKFVYTYTREVSWQVKLPQARARVYFPSLNPSLSFVLILYFCNLFTQRSDTTSTNIVLRVHLYCLDVCKVASFSTCSRSHRSLGTNANLQYDPKWSPKTRVLCRLYPSPNASCTRHERP